MRWCKIILSLFIVSILHTSLMSALTREEAIEEAIEQDETLTQPGLHTFHISYEVDGEVVEETIQLYVIDDLHATIEMSGHGFEVLVGQKENITFQQWIQLGNVKGYDKETGNNVEVIKVDTTYIGDDIGTYPIIYHFNETSLLKLEVHVKHLDSIGVSNETIYSAPFKASEVLFLNTFNIIIIALIYSVMILIILILKYILIRRLTKDVEEILMVNKHKGGK